MSLVTTLIPSAARALRLAVPMLALIAVPTFASSSDSYRATINLPFEARWDRAVLEPGRYTISVETTPNGGQFVYIHGRATNMAILAGPSESAKLSLNSHITLVNVGGTYVVKSLDAGVMGRSFKFKTPKGLLNESVRTRAAAETVIEATGTL